MRSKPQNFSEGCETSSSEDEETSDPMATSNSSDNNLLDMQCIKKYELSELMSQIDDNDVAMPVVVSEGKHCACHCIVGKQCLAELHVDVNCGCCQNGVWFHEINLAHGDHHVESSADVHVDCCAASLPMNVDGCTLHGITTSDWRTWDQDALLVSPFLFFEHDDQINEDTNQFHSLWQSAVVFQIQHL